MSVYNNLLLLKSKIETDFPGLLLAEGLANMDEYVLGGPSDSEVLALGFYLGPGDQSAERINFKPVIQMQLKAVQYDEGLKYFDVLYNLIASIDPSLIDMLVLDRLAYTEFPLDQTGTTVFNVYPDYRIELDDCYGE